MLPPYINHYSPSPQCSYPTTSQFKTSLNFILSAPDATPNPPEPKTTASLSPSPPMLSRLESLPRTLLSQIAYHLILTPSSTSQTPHPSPMIPLLLTSTSLHSSLNFASNPLLYNTLFRATFDHAALTRRYDWMKEHLSDVAGRGKKMFDLFGDPKSWAEDYKARWELAGRMKREVRGFKGGREGGEEGKEVEGGEDEERVNQDLWCCWFLLTENDGRNLPFLMEECNFQAWIVSHYRQNMLKDSLVPGYPKETGGKALATWCALLSGTDLSNSTPAEVDEKIFINRPYVFACAKYDVTYAPWHYRQLPLAAPATTPHEPDVNIRSKAMPYKRFGYSWLRAPPHFILGCHLLFLRLLEQRQPSRTHPTRPGSSTFAALSNRISSQLEDGLFSKTKILPSTFHDREWQRNSVCQDPHQSPGLPALTFRGNVAGFWRAKFLFCDFEMYRNIIGGDMRTVYRGMFAEQVAELELRETVIRVRREEVGGKGPMLCAGFEEGVGDDGDVVGGDEEQRRIEGGYGWEVLGKDREGEVDEEGWTKEILISGTCRTAWGLARVRGRVRSWDGLVVLALSYSRHIMGKWLWRGYIHTGGHLIGRWRDTFTPEHLRGHEGAFGMVRAGDPFWPEGYPTRMEPVLGTGPAVQAQPPPQVNGHQAIISPAQGQIVTAGNGDGDARLNGIGQSEGADRSRGLAAVGSPETQLESGSAQIFGQAGPVRDHADDSMRGSSSPSKTSDGSRGLKRGREDEAE